MFPSSNFDSQNWQIGRGIISDEKLKSKYVVPTFRNISLFGLVVLEFLLFLQKICAIIQKVTTKLL